MTYLSLSFWITTVLVFPVSDFVLRTVDEIVLELLLADVDVDVVDTPALLARSTSPRLIAVVNALQVILLLLLFLKFDVS